MAILNVYKPLGWTPLACIEALKELQPDYRDTPITYAGRLDPMAQGVLLLLTGEDRHNKPDFLELSKTYEATIVFGLASDTHDALGMISLVDPPPREAVESALSALLGTHILPFPAYSSFKVSGKPLHWWAREGRLHEIKRPVKEMTVLATNTQTISMGTLKDIRETATEQIALVKGNFRQPSILDTWNTLNLSETSELSVATLLLEVTSGTYIRSLAHWLGKQAQSDALLLSLKRTDIGPFNQNDAMQLNSP